MSKEQFKRFCKWTERQGFEYEEDDDYYLSKFMSPISGPDLQAFYMNLYHKTPNPAPMRKKAAREI